MKTTLLIMAAGIGSRFGTGMNMWGLTPDFLDVLEEGFKEFFEKEVPGNPLKAEYLIPIFIHRRALFFTRVEPL